MKGQFIFEFVVACLMFFMIIVFAINYLNLSVSDFSGRFEGDEVQAKALWVSEVLTNPGSNMSLVDEWPYFSPSRIEDFDDTYCGSGKRAEFNSLKKELNVRFEDDFGSRMLPMRIMILSDATGMDDEGNKILDCGQRSEEIRWGKEIQRIGMLKEPGMPVEVVVMKVFIGSG